MAVLMILLSMLRFILTDPILDLQELIQELKEKMVEVQQYEECWFVDSVGKSGCASWFSRVQKHFVFYLIDRGAFHAAGFVVREMFGGRDYGGYRERVLRMEYIC